MKSTRKYKYILYKYLNKSSANCVNDITVQMNMLTHSVLFLSTFRNTSNKI